MQSNISCLFPITAYGEWGKGWGVPYARETPSIENGIEKWENDTHFPGITRRLKGFLKLLLYHLSYLNTADNPANRVRSQVCSELDKSYPTNLGSTNVKPKLHVGFI